MMGTSFVGRYYSLLHISIQPRIRASVLATTTYLAVDTHTIRVLTTHNRKLA